jgi:uncharacterized membrane protein YhhN
VLASIVAVLVSGALAIVAYEKGWRRLEVVLKPLTTLLLLVVVGWPGSAFARFVVAGLLLSTVGDIALLGQNNREFLIGLAAFLLAHVAYVIAFVGVAVWSAPVAVVAILAALSTTMVLRAIWKGAAGLHLPTVAYGAVISAMVVSAAATVGGRLVWGSAAAVGAVLFYTSDTCLALHRFRRPIPHVAIATMGIYWLGQIGISLAARFGMR